MEKRSNPAARIFAIFALVIAVVAVIAVVSGAVGGSSSSSDDGGTHHAKKHHRPKATAASYVVESGDTLTSIAHETGIPVATILKLNPEVDPQILIAGEKLKLR
jgi:LysM repeat protein